MKRLTKLLIKDETGEILEYSSGLKTEYDEVTKTLNFSSPEGGSVELTEEHLTGETYNGKPVYRKIVDVVTLKASVTSATTYQHGITNVEMVLPESKVVAVGTSNNNIQPMYSSSSYYIAVLSIGRSSISIKVVLTNADYPVIIRLDMKYTKTTD